MHGSYSYEQQPSNTTRKVSKRSQEPDKKGVNWRHNWKDYTYAGREKSRIFRIGEGNCARTWGARSTSVRRYRRRTKQRIYKRIQSWESLQSNVAGGNKLSNDETYVGVASHLHRRSAYRVQHQAHVLRSTPLLPRVPKRAYQPPNNGRPIIIDSLSLSPLPSLDMLQLPRPPPNLSTIFSCFVAVSGDPLPQHRHTRPRVIAAEGSFFLGRSHRSNTLSRDRLSGSCIVDEDDHRCYSLSISLLFLERICSSLSSSAQRGMLRNSDALQGINCFPDVLLLLSSLLKRGFFFFNRFFNQHLPI